LAQWWAIAPQWRRLWRKKHGGTTGTCPRISNWISQQVPDGTDWLEYMLVHGPEKTGIPASMSQEQLGVLDHFSLGVRTWKNR